MTATDDHESAADDHETAPRDTQPLADVEPLPPSAVPPVVVPRWIQLVLLPLAVVAAYGLLRAAGGVLLLFVIAGLIALLLNPFVTLLRRTGLPRGISVVLVFLALLTVLVGLGAALANPIADQVSSIQDNVPGYVRDANRSLGNVQTFFDNNGINVQIADQGRTALQTLGTQLTTGSGNIVSFTRDALTKLVEASLALILIVVLSVYLLLYGERIGAAVRGIIPSGDGSPEDDFPSRIQQAVLGYVRGQLLFSLIMGTSAGVMLALLGALGIFPDGKTYALAFGAFYGFAELIPYVGPAIGAAPPLFAALLGADPIDGLWLVIGFTALQQLEGHVVAPNIFASALRINPILVIFALLMGAQLYGFVGAFMALPIAAMIRETVIYFRRHLVLEPWPVSTPGAALRAAGVEVSPSPPATGPRCPECAAHVEEGDAACGACGTELGDEAARAAAASAGPG